MTRAQETFLDENRELFSFSHGQHWTPDAGQSSTPVYKLRGVFGVEVARIVDEVTDVKFLAKESRKRLQVSKAARASDRARLVKLADKICNLRDILASPPAGSSLARRQEYFDWAKAVVDQARGVNPKLERMFDRLYLQRPA